jgi:integrase
MDRAVCRCGFSEFCRGFSLNFVATGRSYAAKTITFRPHEWRRLKTLTSFRTVPLWPQLEEILRAYVFGGDGPPGELLFPSHRTPRKEKPDDRPAEAMLADVRKTLDAIARRAGWKEGEIRTKAFRHTYTATRLQTLDRGAPVSVWTVGRELGHGGDAMVRKVYGHLGELRHRAEVVEYRVEQHLERLTERLEKMGV